MSQFTNVLLFCIKVICHTSACPPIDIDVYIHPLWLCFPRPLFLGDPNMEVTNRGQLLRIRSARLGDAARYQCSVSNAAGNLLKDFNLSVYGESPWLNDVQ